MTTRAMAEPSRPRGRSTDAEMAGREVFRHRIHVIAALSADVVCSAGGWLADRALAGWDVLVYLPDDQDVAPLRVLGVTPRSLAQLPTVCAQGRRRTRVNAPTVLAADSAVIDGNPLARRCIDNALADTGTEIVVWGEGLPESITASFVRTAHRASTAGRAFKAHAMRAAAAPPHAPETAEVLYTRAAKPAWSATR